jgi:hypothetical protein
MQSSKKSAGFPVFYQEVLSTWYFEISGHHGNDDSAVWQKLKPFGGTCCPQIQGEH